MAKRRRKKSWARRVADEYRELPDGLIIEMAVRHVIVAILCLASLAVLFFYIWDKPISGETVRKNLDLNLYVNGHIIHDGYVAVHNDGTCSFTCFQEDGKRINMTVPISSTDIQVVPEDDSREGIYNVVILETEIVGKLSGRHISTGYTYTIFIPDNAYAIEYEQ